MREITIYGLVQGVGFRPFVAEAAQDLSISGTVMNAGGIVKVRTASSNDEALDEFIQRLSSCQIPGARVDRIEIKRVEDTQDLSTSGTVMNAGGIVADAGRVGEAGATGDAGRAGDAGGMEIIPSESLDDEIRMLPPDIATCDRCEAELTDPMNRRYRYPFISCTACGPRFSIMKDLPYDRERTSMADFELCSKCAKEYKRPGDIRRHAQTIACEECGPKVRLITRADEEQNTEAVQLSDAALVSAVDILKNGGIVAVKDIGGFHFCFDPYSEEAGEKLRQYKNRDNKPFAVMFKNIDAIREMAHVSDTELRILTSPERPIVLLNKKAGMDFAVAVCGGYPRVGAMLPCNPLQILLLNELGTLVMTSGNRGGEPIATTDEPMIEAMREGWIDAVLTHDRDIVNGQDDSVYQVTEAAGAKYVQILRRARGSVPMPIEMPVELPCDMFAAGADLKNVFALGRKNMAYLSAHFGDLDDVRCTEKREESIKLLESLTGINPTEAVCDKHPGYVSVKKTEEAYSQPAKIQHHVAHIASVIAEHAIKGDVTGVAFDGTGYGDDGTIWGSEIFRINKKGYERRGHFSAIMMTGGDAAAKDANVALYAYLIEAEKRGLLTDGEVDATVGDLNAYDITKKAIEAGINTVMSSSMGRLFDAVSSLLGICYENTHEGECAMKLQAAAERYYDRSKENVSSIWAPMKVEGGVYVADSVYMMAQLAKAMLYGEDADELAFMFHMAIAEATSGIIGVISDHAQTVALSGGCMCNSLLLRLLIPMLKSRGHDIYLNEKVPCTDGGIALGQLLGKMTLIHDK